MVYNDCKYELVPLVDGSPHRATPPSTVNGGEWHVRVLEGFQCHHLTTIIVVHLVLNLDIFPLVLEVDPCV